MYDVIRNGLSCVLDYCAVYGVCSFQSGDFVFANELTKARVEVWQFGCGGGVVGAEVAGYRPCSEAANRRIILRKRDVREDVPVDNPRAPAFAASLWVTPVWDLTLPILIVRPSCSLLCVLLLAFIRRSRCG